jgi:hypothetical protein
MATSGALPKNRDDSDDGFIEIVVRRLTGNLRDNLIFVWIRHDPFHIALGMNRSMKSKCPWRQW